MPFVCGLLSYFLFGLALPFLLTHPKLRAGLRQRLGHVPALPTTHQRGAAVRVWVHGASAGDILALLPTVRALRARRPGVHVIASTITNSGHAIACQHADVFDTVVYAPYDLPTTVRRSLARLRPDVLVLEYTELWPQLIRAARRQGVRLVLHNGRLDEQRLHRYRWLFYLTGNLLAQLSLLLMRDEGEAERALQLGATPSSVVVTGNTKFDNLGAGPDATRVAELGRALGLTDSAPLWVAGSTHEGEEDALLDVFAHLRQATPTLRLLIAPRYMERCERVAQLIQKRGFCYSLRSRPRAGADVTVLDSLGELPHCYALATLVFVGGSFVPRGGQNILEPAACGRPVLFGPHMHNFADSVQVLLGRGGIQVMSPQQLTRVMDDLLQRRSYLRELGAIARTQVTNMRGAAARNATLLGNLVDRPADFSVKLG